MMPPQVHWVNPSCSGDESLQWKAPLSIENKLLSNGAAIPASRSVRFADVEVTVHAIPSLEDLSLHDKEDLWLSKRDLQRISQDVSRDLMLTSLKHHSTNATRRGLEWKSFEGIQKRYRFYRSGLDAVLKEQQRQRKEGSVDEEELAELYRNVAQVSQAEAYSMAEKDQAEAAW
eukprot:Nitzschia sp. Nitz4//scaffold265_size26576//14774//15295//NITZ4_008249-RA/size26576-processed-gene-0.12-mRNA-1//1//CDS//3329544843//5010//frame0